MSSELTHNEATVRRLHTEKGRGNEKSVAADLVAELQFAQAFQVIESRTRKHVKGIII